MTMELAVAAMLCSHSFVQSNYSKHDYILQITNQIKCSAMSEGSTREYNMSCYLAYYPVLAHHVQVPIHFETVWFPAFYPRLDIFQLFQICVLDIFFIILRPTGFQRFYLMFLVIRSLKVEINRSTLSHKVHQEAAILRFFNTTI